MSIGSGGRWNVERHSTFGIFIHSFRQCRIFRLSTTGGQKRQRIGLFLFFHVCVNYHVGLQTPNGFSGRLRHMRRRTTLCIRFRHTANCSYGETGKLYCHQVKQSLAAHREAFFFSKIYLSNPLYRNKFHQPRKSLEFWCTHLVLQ